MNIAIVASYWTHIRKDGYSLRARNLAVALARHGDSVVVFTPRGLDKVVCDGIDVISLPGIGADFDNELSETLGGHFDFIVLEGVEGQTLIEQKRFAEKIVCHPYYNTLERLQTIVNNNIINTGPKGGKYTLYERGSTLCRNVLAERMAFEGACVVVTSNEQMRDDFVERYHLRNVQMLYPCVDTDFFAPMEYTPDRTKPVTCVMASSYMWWENIKELLWIVRKSGCLLKYHGDGPYKEWVTEIATELGVKGNVMKRNFVPMEELRESYSNADVYIDTSLRHESMSLSVIEALSCGKPVVCNSCGGKSKLPVVFKYSLGDVDEGAQLIGVIGAYSDETFERIGQRNREFALEHFSMDVCARRFHRILEATR